MVKIFIIALLVSVSNGFLLNPRFIRLNQGKIVGGIQIGIEDAPYQISLQSRNFHICGGSIISQNFVLTACHCTDGSSARDLQIRAGSEKYASGGVAIQVKRIIQHEKYNYFNIDYDFSLLELAETIQYSLQIQPIQLPEQDEPVEDDTLCLVSGWGNTQSAQEPRDKLRAAYVPSANQEECHEAYKAFGGITDRMICAGYKKGGKDACQGDSGGPLVAEEKLVGVVSWGYQCALPNYPGVYSRTASVRDWIKENSGV
jgi:trypsin